MSIKKVYKSNSSSGLVYKKGFAKNRTVTSHECEQEYHWVSGHYKTRKFGFGMIYVKGYCAKDGDVSGMKITERKTKMKIKLPIIDIERINTEKPLEGEEQNDNQEGDR